ncbi:MAG: Lrp/AsnC family transcriptional regulator [Rhodospirillaceae bacterium]|nr:Lrp/AsnC family transcriptional regulator [Rhodospirillaceae bacterium]
MPNPALDAIDLNLLRAIQDNARISNVELAEAIGLSPSPCLRRLKQLEARGVIRGYTTLIDQNAVGLPVSVFVSVALKEQSEPALEEFERRIRELPQVMECYLMTGTSDYLLRVVTADLAAYERFLKDHLTRIPVIASIQSSFALKQVSARAGLPLPSAKA